MATKKPAAAGAAGGLRAVVERADLLRALTATTRTVESRNTYPILANVLLVAEPGSLTVRATDLDIEITASTAADVEGAGSTTVPAKTLLDIVRKFPDGAEVTLELEPKVDARDGDTLIVKAGRSRFQLPTIAADSYPALQVGEFGAPFTTDLAALTGQVAFAISQDSNRYYLNGVFMHVVDGRLRAVATDGHRLARFDGDATDAKFTAIIIPTKTVGLLPAGEVQVEVSATKIRITSGAVTLVSKLIEGEYPDYARVIPRDNDKLATVDRAALLAAVDRVSVVASERGGKSVKVSASPGLLTLDVTNTDGGAASEDVAADSEHAFVIGYNAGYLADILRVLGGSTAKFAWNEPGSPTVITGDNDNLLLVCMPMRVA